MKATTINEVIDALDVIILNSKDSKSPLGYFAALYRKVTIGVKKGIAEGDFEDGARMEKLDVIFANRYLEAYNLYQKGEDPSLSWAIAFTKSKNYWPIVLQHLLWGINAHINLDLGIAAVETVDEENETIHDLKNDFNKINELLAGLVGEVEQELSNIWPTLKFILKISGKIDGFLINFSMRTARDGAWKFATELSEVRKENRREMITERDVRISEIANYISSPGVIASLIFKWIRLGEKGDVVERIEILE